MSSDAEVTAVMRARVNTWWLSIFVVLGMTFAVTTAAGEVSSDASGVATAGSVGSAEQAQPAPQATSPQATPESATADSESSDGTPPAQFSEAETILWLTDQLKNINKPTRLKYEFKKTGSLEEGFVDSVQLDITELLPDGMKKANVNFFTGARNHYVPPYESLNGNPLLAIYLHGDVLEMNRLTDGGWRYFQRRIKFAFAESAEVTPVEIEFNGQRVQGKQVKITPYVDDPQAEKSEKFRKLKDKTYLITISDNIPGYLFEIRAFVPSAKGATSLDAPLLDEYLKLVSVEDI